MAFVLRRYGGLQEVTILKINFNIFNTTIDHKGKSITAKVGTYVVGSFWLATDLGTDLGTSWVESEQVKQ